MEKTNKYYGIIESLVRKHKKFLGCEPILDEIIDDVYSHSEVIINSISNDSVISAYLEKVVSTSIITVPKRLHFQPDVPKRTAPEISDVLQVNTALVDKMINGGEQSQTIEKSISVDESFEDGILEEEPLDVHQPETVDMVTELKTDEANESNEESFELLEPNSAGDVLEELDENSQDLGQTLDMELSEEPADLTEEEETVSIDESEEEIVEVAKDDVNVDELEVLDLDESDSNSVSEILSEVEPVETILEEESDSIELVEMPNKESDVVDEDLSSELILESGIIDNAIEDLTELPVEDSTLELDAGAESFDLEDLAFSEALQVDSEVEMAAKPAKSCDYSVFDFTPMDSTGDFDIKEIAEDIEKINSKRPELNIINVFNMKYKQNYPVEKISEELGISKENVLEALSEIIATV